MLTSSICRNYAKALLSFSKEKGKESSVKADMDVIVDTVSANQSLLRVFCSPVVSNLEKEKVANQVFDKVTDVTKRFLSVLAKNGRMSLIDGVATSFQTAYKQSEGIKDVVLSSAIPLEKKVKDKIKRKIESFGIKVGDLEEKVDSSLLGGYSLKIDNGVYDGTLKSQILRLKEQITG